MCQEKEGRRGLTSIQDSVDELIQKLEKYIKNGKNKNCMDISSNKRVKFNKRKVGNG